MTTQLPADIFRTATVQALFAQTVGKLVAAGLSRDDAVDFLMKHVTLQLTESGLPFAEAFDCVLGAGTYRSIADDVYAENAAN